ncbi:NHL repeat-containing protein [Noviherbaspirillum cavernae]|nr:NHL repeat-containing protein [Noviherbaspirillum cavernae]
MPRCFLACLFCATLASCGGGGGSGDSTAGLQNTSTATQPSSTGTPQQQDDGVPQNTAGISLIAGSIGGPGALDATGTAARFHDPYGIAADAAGNLYIADTANHIIRKVTPAGAVSTLAGTAGVFGSADGNGAAARFSSPRGIVVDGAGNVYVADRLNHAIRRITPSGAVATIAGAAGSSGSADGAGSTARFNGPSGIAIDALGNLYVADTDNVAIRKITPSGDVTTLAGMATESGSVDGAGSTARFNGPSSIAIDATGNLFVTDTYHFPTSHSALDNSTIRKITPTGIVTTLAGSSGSLGSTDGSGTLALFYYPSGITVDAAGNLFVSDTWNHTIRRITPAGAVSTFAGTAGISGSDDGTGAAARFFYPSGVTSDSAGNLYVVDSSNATLRKVTPGAAVTTLAGMASQSGSADGIGADARFSGPYGIAADAAGNLYIADAFSATIRKIAAGGVVTTLAGSAGSYGTADGAGALARFGAPHGIASDGAGNLFITDTASHTIRKIDTAGRVSTFAGTAGVSGRADGQGVAASFSSPNGIALDAGGNLYVADTDNHLVRKITAAGSVTTLAGSAGTAGSADGIGTAALFSSPQGIAVDGAGNVYVADTNNHAIRKIAPNGVVTTLAGIGGSAGFADGAGAAARFDYPQSIALDAAGNLFVADTVNEAVRKVTSAGAVTTVAGIGGRRGIVLGALPGGLSRPFGIAFVRDGMFAVTSGTGVLRLDVQ